MEDLQKFNKIYIVACGTAYHAGMVGKYAIEKMARIPVEVDVASEFRYRDPFVDEKTLFIAISQSGETLDTLAALREAKRKGARVLSVVNVVGSLSLIHIWGKQVVVLVGSERKMHAMIDNNRIKMRYSGLKYRLQSLMEAEEGTF